MLKNMFITIIISLIGIIMVSGCSSDAGKDDAEGQKTIELVVSAASSLTDALTEIKEIYEKENETVTLIYNFGGSGKLAQQVEQGAPVDVYISADTNWMDLLEQESLLMPNSRIDFISNRIVLIGSNRLKNKIHSLQDLNGSEISQIAIGEPLSVPVGKYSKQVLEQVGQWETIQDKLVLAKDVRQVVTYVESGNADIGFVYGSDALLAKDVTTLAEVDESLHSPIIYPAGVIVSSQHEREAREFVAFLQTKTAQAILEKYGFEKDEKLGR